MLRRTTAVVKREMHSDGENSDCTSLLASPTISFGKLAACSRQLAAENLKGLRRVVTKLQKVQNYESTKGKD